MTVRPNPNNRTTPRLPLGSGERITDTTFTSLKTRVSTSSRGTNFHISLAEADGITASTPCSKHADTKSQNIVLGASNKFTVILREQDVYERAGEPTRLASSQTRTASFACHSTFRVALPVFRISEAIPGLSFTKTPNVLPPWASLIHWKGRLSSAVQTSTGTECV